MTIRNMEYAVRPQSVAVFGASDREGSVGAVVMRNLIEGGFEGAVWPVNPKHREVAGRACVGSAADLPAAPDLSVVLVPPHAVPRVIDQIGKRGGKAAVVLTAGITDANGLRDRMLAAARPYLLRVIGPNTVGLIVPPAKLNASFAHMGAAPGRLALLSQSGAIATALIDWAAERNIGFSHIVSLGDMADVDVSDFLDLLAGDGRTNAILMYLESMPRARKFLSAARAAARVKPVIALKAGRSAQAAKAAKTHTGALSGADAAVDAALRRAGVLRVRGLSEMFAAAETVARFRPLERARLGIVTNGGGAGVLAVDRLMDGAGELAELSAATAAELDPVLPENWSRANPVDIIGDAPPERYRAALAAVGRDPDVDVLLAINCPTALASPSAAAATVASMVEKGMINGKPLLACWLGGTTARGARTILRAAGVASYDNPASAAAAVGHLTEWGRLQAALMQVPDRAVETALRQSPPDAAERVRDILGSVARAGRSMLTEPEAKSVLAAYGIDVPDTRVARSPSEAGAIASEMLPAHGRLVVKLLSEAISHKSDVGGVVLNLESPAEVEHAARAIAGRVARAAGEKAIDGFAVQPMIRRPGAHELILGLGRDPVIGPVILFGAGGIAVEVLRDTAVALPPLDAVLASELISRTRIAALLRGYRDQAPADIVAIQSALIALSHLTEDFPCLRSVDINPLLAGPEGVIALDARIEIDPDDIDRQGPNPDLAIRPYPGKWRRSIDLGGEVFTLRPIRPADALLYEDFFAHVDPEDIRMRFMAPRKHFSEETALRLTQLDYDRDMAFVALDPEGALAGVSRIACDPDHRTAEYALIVRSDRHGRGLGTALMRILIDYARADGVVELAGMILTENRPMQALVRRLGFSLGRIPDDYSVVMSRLRLDDQA